MASTTTHPWLARLSDYHSGGVSAAEGAAVEAHLATCQQCQQALADYRRLYALAAKPVRLGPPSFRAKAGSYMSMSDLPSTPERRSNPGRPVTVAITLVAVLALIVGFLALFNLHGASSVPAHGTPTPHGQATSTIAPTGTVAQPTSTTTVTADQHDICANPVGSSLRYAFSGTNTQVYEETGCAPPVQLTHFTNGGGTPIGWSPSQRLLAISTGAIPSTNGAGDNIVVIDTTNDALTPTNYSYFDTVADNQTARIVHQFIGLIDDQSFLGAIMTFPASGNATVGPVQIVRVNIQTHAETLVTKIAWVADMELRAGALFYGGYESASEGGAFLHRVNLATGSDTKLVALGIAGDNGCMAGPPCNWTGPWDVSPDGTKVAYHHPGPASTPSDIHTVSDTPLLVANIDGSGAHALFGGSLLEAISTPTFAPSGAWVARLDNPPAGHLTIQVQAVVGGTTITIPAPVEPGIAWRTDSKALVFTRYTAGVGPAPLLFTLADGKVTPLTVNTNFYLWAA